MHAVAASPIPTSDRATARAVGILFVVATVVFLIGGGIYGPPTAEGEWLTRASSEAGTVRLGVLVEFVSVLAIPLIGLLAFPVLRRWNEGVALAYAGFRLLEAALLIAAEAKILSLVDLSAAAEGASAAETARLGSLGDGVLAETERLFGLYVLVFGVGALLFYGLLHASRLVPRWLADWGFLAAAWMVAGMVYVTLTDAGGAALEASIVLPIAINEMVLAAVLIIRGFARPPEPHAAAKRLAIADPRRGRRPVAA